MLWTDCILTFCLLLTFLFRAGNGVDGGINRKSALQEDADLILSLSERLYRRADEEIAEEKREVVEDDRRSETKSWVDAGWKDDDEDDYDNLKRVQEEDKTSSLLAERDQASVSGTQSGANEANPTPEKDVEVVPLVAEGGSGAGVDHTYMVIIIAVCCLAGVIALVMATVCYYNLQNKKKQTKEIPYMSSPVYEYKSVSTTKNYSGNDYAPGHYPTDNALALSAQKFHFQHEKEKLIAMENEKNQMEPATLLSVDENDGVDEVEEVYETPGLAGMYDPETGSPLYPETPGTSPGVTPGTTPRNHTPMMYMESNTSGLSGGEMEGVEMEGVNGGEIGAANGGVNGKENGEPNGEVNGLNCDVNENTLERPPTVNVLKPIVNLGFNGEVNANSALAVNNDENGAPDNGVNGMNGTNGYHE